MQLAKVTKNEPLTSEISAIPSGKDGVRVTLRRMSSLIKEGKTNLKIRLLSQNLISNIQEKQWLKEVKALHAFVRDEIRYTRDVRGVETLHTPQAILRIRQGDCDDKSILLASMLESIGHPTRLVAVGFNPLAYSHVYVETRVGRRWIPLETTERVKVGWQPKNIMIRMVVNN